MGLQSFTYFTFQHEITHLEYSAMWAYSFSKDK